MAIRSLARFGEMERRQDVTVPAVAEPSLPEAV
jgi:hypothetical protein